MRLLLLFSDMFMVKQMVWHLAHFASHSSFNDLWLDETPSIIENVLYEDYCNCTRSLGITYVALEISHYLINIFISQE